MNYHVEKRLSKLNWNAALLLIASTICLSPLFIHFSPISGNLVSLISLLTLYLVSNSIGSKRAMITVMVIIVIAIMNSLYWNAFTFKVTIYITCSLLIVFLLKIEDIKKYTEYLTILMMLTLVGAIIGAVYAYYGGDAIITFENEDTRPTSLYLSTFSALNLNGLIRPSGFFDEPGAFSFIICICVALRECFKMNQKLSFYLLLFGMLTLSTAHVIFFLLYCIRLFSTNSKKFIRIFVFLSLLLYGLLSFENPISNVFFYILWKFTILDGSIVADNRTPLIINSWNYLTFETLFWGVDGRCIMNLPGCIEAGFHGYCCNPLTLLVHYGIFIAWPYYIIMAYIFIISIKRGDVVLLGVFLLLLQRPYVMSYGYSVSLILYIFIVSLGRKIYFRNHFLSTMQKKIQESVTKHAI